MVGVASEFGIQSMQAKFAACKSRSSIAFNAKARLLGPIGQALIDAKQSGRDPFAAIEAVMSWAALAESVTKAKRLAQPEDFDFLHRIGESYATLRRHAVHPGLATKHRTAPPCACRAEQG